MNQIVVPNTVRTQEDPNYASPESNAISADKNSFYVPTQSRLPDNWLTADVAALAKLGEFQCLDWPATSSNGLSLSVKRDDLIDPELGGNKLYKLFGHLNHYLSSLSDDEHPLQIATVGGAYSNHIYALAEATMRLSIPSVAVIRGEEPTRLSPTLVDAQNKGMKLIFVSREKFRLRDTEPFRKEIEAAIGRCFWVPEGGAGNLGNVGSQALGYEIATNIQSDILSESVTVCLACGTATTMSGVIDGIFRQLGERTSNRSQNIKILGISALKSRSSLVRSLYTLSNDRALSNVSWQISNQFHLGGYAKTTKALLDFTVLFEQQTQIPLDRVYTAKLFWAIDQLAKQGYWAPGSRIVAIHSGGLQGNRKPDDARA